MRGVNDDKNGTIVSTCAVGFRCPQLGPPPCHHNPCAPGPEAMTDLFFPQRQLLSTAIRPEDNVNTGYVYHTPSAGVRVLMMAFLDAFDAKAGPRVDSSDSDSSDSSGSHSASSSPSPLIAGSYRPPTPNYVLGRPPRRLLLVAYY